VEEKDVLARRRALIDELDLFDNSATAAHAGDRSSYMVDFYE